MTTTDISSSFITEVHGQSHRTTEDHGGRLDQCRRDYVKIKEVVEAFSAKVEILIDKQRAGYIQAYDNHMTDVQKELISLREKVADIANAETKNAKTKSLKSEETKFKNEALGLLASSDEFRKKIRVLVKKTYSAEKTRDWMLNKLREAKKEFEFLSQEKARLFDSLDKQSYSQASIGVSLGEGSTYSIELGKRESKSMLRKKSTLVKGTKGQENPTWEAKLSHDYNVSRQDVLVDILNGKKDNHRDKQDLSNSLQEKKNILMNTNAKAQLIAVRTRRQEIKDFLKLCANSLHKGPWCRVQQRPLEYLIDDCLKVSDENQQGLINNFSSNKTVLQLACELAAHPETYSAILTIIEERKESSLFQYIPSSSPSSVNGNEKNIDYLFSDAPSSPPIRPPSSPKQEQEIDQFKKNIKNILSKENNIPKEDDSVRIKTNSLLDMDVVAYFKQEKNDLVLRSLGYFEEDDFMNFK